MLTVKPWPVEAIVRLVLSVILCAYAGSVLISVQAYAAAGVRGNAKLFFPLAAGALVCLAAALGLIARAWPPEGISRRLAGLVVCAYSGLLLGAWAQQLSGAGAGDASLSRMLMAALSFHGAGLILIGRFLREQQTHWTAAFGLAHRWRRAALMGALGALLFLPMGWGLQKVSALVLTHLPHLGLTPKEQLPVTALREALTWGGRLSLGAAAVLLAPVAEETMFRGILYPVIKQAGYPRLAWWGTALLFALVHLNLVTFVPLLVLALLLTELYERTGNLLAPITAHLLFNALNFAALLVLQHYGGA